MNLAPEVIISPFIAAGLAALVSWFKSDRDHDRIVISVQQRIDDKEKSDKEAAELREKARIESATAVEKARIEAAQSLEKALKERHDEYCRRFDRIESKVGVSNGGAFVDREFCREVHRLDAIDNGALRARVEAAIKTGEEAIRIGHQDREEIKQRITKLEVVVQQKLAS